MIDGQDDQIGNRVSKLKRRHKVLTDHLPRHARIQFRTRKKKGMVAHPRVLTQRTPVLRSGDLLSLLCALLSAAFFRGGLLLRAALLCSCHSVLLLSLVFTSYTRYCSVATLVY